MSGDHSEVMFTDLSLLDEEVVVAANSFGKFIGALNGRQRHREFVADSCSRELLFGVNIHKGLRRASCMIVVHRECSSRSKRFVFASNYDGSWKA